MFFLSLPFPYEVRYPYRPQTQIISLNYPSLQAPMGVHEAHVNKLFSLPWTTKDHCAPPWHPPPQLQEQDEHHPRGALFSTSHHLCLQISRYLSVCGIPERLVIPRLPRRDPRNQAFSRLASECQGPAPEPLDAAGRKAEGSEERASHLPHPTSWECPGTSLPHRKLCSGLSAGRPRE